MIDTAKRGPTFSGKATGKMRAIISPVTKTDSTLVVALNSLAKMRFEI